MKSLYRFFTILQLQNHSTELLHREDRNSSFFVKSLRSFSKILPIFRRAMKIESNEITCIRFFAILQLQNHSTEPQLIRRASQKLLPILRRVMKMESNEITIPIFRNTPITESLHREDRNSSSIKSARRSKRAKRSRDFN